jgi:hypothetical protein
MLYESKSTEVAPDFITPEVISVIIQPTFNDITITMPDLFDNVSKHTHHQPTALVEIDAEVASYSLALSNCILDML